MENMEESIRGSLPTIHEYPDPDYAAYVTRYPWVGDGGESGYPEPPHEPDRLWGGRSQLHDRSTLHPAEDGDSDEYVDRFPSPNKEITFDPDYRASDDAAGSEDENLSSDDSGHSGEAALGFDDSSRRRSSVLNGPPHILPARAPRARGSGRRARRGELGRGGRKGVKRGPRKAIEPTEEFKALHSQATMAFIDHDYDEAERLTLQAILINPEMYPSHNLLSQIHDARGDEDKAISAAWAAAHTKHRDPEIWSRTARLILGRKSEDRISTLRGAIYCINRILGLDKNNVGARYQRAILYHELGHKNKAAVEFEQLINQLPNDTTVLRHLAEIYIELDQPKRALEHYRSSISRFQANRPDGLSSFTWSDINIVAELYGLQQQYDEGMTQLKSLSRWLLGRGEDLQWENFDQDDREWDVDDKRRISLSTFDPNKYDLASYGDGLPLELRVKLGIFRLKSPKYDLEEAKQHFEWLEPEDDEAGAKLYDYPDLFREAADGLREMNDFMEALRYYEPLQQVDGCVDVPYLFEIASCYRALGRETEAKNCYKSIVEIDGGNYEARLRLADGHDVEDMTQCSPQDLSQTYVPNHPRTWKHMGIKHARQGKSAMSLAPRAAHPSSRRLADEELQVHEREIYGLFTHQQSIGKAISKGDGVHSMEWLAATESLLQDFRENKIFYPVDKHHKFLGYSREARLIAARTKSELEMLIERSGSIIETPAGDQISVPTTYCGIKFQAWLDMFLEYAIAIAYSGDLKSAYEIIDSAYHANVFYHSPESLCLIHVCWFTCALLGNDDETLCNIARWFMKEYQFVTDGYRLFSALNRLCNSDNSWFNCGPSQKYILRQLKAVDFSLLGDARRRTFFQERASYTTKDDDGNQIQAAELDVSLLILYGHILHAGKSYAYAVNYYLRALALDPGNATIKLSLALGYIHYALKRQADNRQHLLMQGLALLLEYYDNRTRSTKAADRQEAEYNVANAFRLLGLVHLAVPYYERCLALSAAVQRECANRSVEEFTREAAVDLQNIWAASGDIQIARDITEKWLVM